MDLFFSIPNMSIASSVLFLLVLLLRRILRGAGGTGFLYMLWMPLLFRMLVPYSLPSPASLFNIFGKDLATPGGVLVSVEYLDPYQPVLQNVAGGEQLFTKQLLAALGGVGRGGAGPGRLGAGALSCSSQKAGPGPQRRPAGPAAVV